MEKMAVQLNGLDRAGSEVGPVGQYAGRNTLMDCPEVQRDFLVACTEVAAEL